MACILRLAPFFGNFSATSGGKVMQYLTAILPVAGLPERFFSVFSSIFNIPFPSL